MSKILNECNSPPKSDAELEKLKVGTTATTTSGTHEGDLELLHGGSDYGCQALLDENEVTRKKGVGEDNENRDHVPNTGDEGGEARTAKKGSLVGIRRPWAWLAPIADTGDSADDDKSFLSQLLDECNLPEPGTSKLHRYTVSLIPCKSFKCSQNLFVNVTLNSLVFSVPSGFSGTPPAGSIRPCRERRHSFHL